MRKKIIYGLVTLVLVFVFWHISFIWYGIQQGLGQSYILWNTLSPKIYLERASLSDSARKAQAEKLELIAEIQRFASDSLGLRANGSYQRVFDQAGKPILWAITACPPFELKAKQWEYGFLGKMPYKGYFDSSKIYQLKAELEREGYETGVYNPAAWSTLGWFREPILSSMLEWSEGFLASVIIHEMTHATIWVKGDIEYNENLADFIGEKGALAFMAQRFGKDSPEYRYFVERKKDQAIFYQHMLQGAEKLEALYAKFTPKTPLKSKQAQKQALIKQIVNGLQDLPFAKPTYYEEYFEESLPNNTYFMQYRRYRGKQQDFEQIVNERFNANLSTYIAYLKKQYPTVF